MPYLRLAVVVACSFIAALGFSTSSVDAQTLSFDVPLLIGSEALPCPPDLGTCILEAPMSPVQDGMPSLAGPRAMTIVGFVAVPLLGMASFSSAMATLGCFQCNNRWPIALASLIPVALGVGIAGSVWLVRSKRERRRMMQRGSDGLALLSW